MDTKRISAVEVQVGEIIYRFDDTSTADGFDKAIRDDIGVGHATLDNPWRDSRSARPRGEPGARHA
ncbi:hypothetical protein [Lacisediminimonas sp.]|uniref:hypothetical protein n=1 Tax=Lacisediminimonas sp. TaxID=3060582 RepID=UPI0027194076|nr:hypothetical protein [Lacisediminimonas sp.]MDO8299510.1 hypothetical protein [Lacisediminimonas sp.]